MQSIVAMRAYRAHFARARFLLQSNVGLASGALQDACKRRGELAGLHRLFQDRVDAGGERALAHHRPDIAADEHDRQVAAAAAQRGANSVPVSPGMTSSVITTSKRSGRSNSASAAAPSGNAAGS